MFLAVHKEVYMDFPERDDDLSASAYLEDGSARAEIDRTEIDRPNDERADPGPDEISAATLPRI